MFNVVVQRVINNIYDRFMHTELFDYLKNYILSNKLYFINKNNPVSANNMYAPVLIDPDGNVDPYLLSTKIVLVESLKVKWL